MIASVIALCLVVVGFAAALLAYSALGNPDRKENVKGLLKTHRILGYIFLLLFLSIFLPMLLRYVTYPNFDTKGVMHSVLALSVVVLLLLKVLIVRRNRKYYSNLVVFGTIVLVMTVSLSVMVAGQTLGLKIRKIQVVEKQLDTAPKTLPSQSVSSNKMTEVENRLVRLCSECHPIAPVIAATHQYRSVEEWRDVIARMASRTDTISAKDAKEISEYLAELSNP